MQKIKTVIAQSARPLAKMLPFLLGIVLLISLVNTLIPSSFYEKIFSKNIILDSVIGSSLGSVLAGNSITSYVMGGEFLKQGVSLVAVTAFLVAWVTVGIIQFAAEASFFGKKFTIFRNLLSFFFAILVAMVTVFIYENI